MKLSLQFRSALLLAASAVTGPVFAQALPPGAIPAAPPAMSGGSGPADPFAGGAYAVPIGAPVTLAYGDPAISSPGTTGPIVSGPSTSSGPVFMAPQVIGGTMPGSPGCNCGPGGTPMMGAPSGGMIMSDPSMGAPLMMDPSTGVPFGATPGFSDPNCAVPGYGAPAYGAPAYGGTGCCLTDAVCCLTSGCCLGGGAGLYDPCQSACPPVYDPCQTGVPPVCDPCQTGGYGTGGLYHGYGGSQRCGWATGFSWVFLKPFYGSNSAFVVTDGADASISRDFDHSLDLSPRVFVEYVGRSDMGLRATWFGFESDADTVSAAVPAGGVITRPIGAVGIPGETVRATSEIDLDTIDFDLTQRIRVRKSLLNVGGGVRWGGYEHEYRSTLVNPVLGTESGDASRQFSGFGPTVFAELRRPIGASRFSLLANIRGSMLYGEADTTNVVDGPFGSSTYHQESDDFVAIGETQLGGEWSAWISPRTVLFVQMAWETQYWLGVGTAFDKNDDLGLFGFSTTVGLEW